MSGLWGPQTALDLYLQENGITTLLFAGVNADQVLSLNRAPEMNAQLTDDRSAQCVLGTIVDSYYRGYDCVALRDCIATTSPQGGLENVFYNCGNVRHCCRRA